MDDEEEKTIHVAEKDDSSSSDDDEVADEGRDVFLGFAVEEEGENDGDEADFPSTLGGKPYWPHSVALLRSEELFACPTCKQSMPLLAQVYAPLEWIEAAHHRFVMVFVCTRAACWRSRDCVLVLRSQLRKEEPPLDPGAERGLSCWVCGKPAFKACGKCHRQHYCCAAHQAADWRAGHKQHCGEPDEPPCAVGLAPHLLLRRMEIVSEREVYVYDKEQIEEAAASNSALMSQELRAKMLPPTAAESKMLQQSKKADSTFLRFVARTKEYQEQVLRYSFGARRPLWVNADNQLIGEPPKCERCGGRRVFELQLMPQLLFFLKVDTNEETAMDWNSLIVYVCEASCDVGETGYAKEYAFVH